MVVMAINESKKNQPRINSKNTKKVSYVENYLLLVVVIYSPTDIGIKSILNLLENAKSNVFISIGIDGKSDKKDLIDRFLKKVFKSKAWLNGRIVVFQSISRIGLVNNWNHTLRIGLTNWIQTTHFAWISDHDYFSPRIYGVSFSKEIIKANSNNYFLYVPTMARKGRNGEVHEIAHDKSHFNHKFIGNYAPGFSIYGIFDVKLFPSRGLSNCLLPDKLLISMLTRNSHIRNFGGEKYGYIRYEPEGHKFSIERQRNGIFPDGFSISKLISFLPWWLVHLMLISFFDLRQNLRGIPPRSGWRKFVYFDLLARSSAIRYTRKTFTKVRICANENRFAIILALLTFILGLILGIEKS